MKYDLAVKEQAKAATAYLADLTTKQKLVEVKRLSPNRSLNQNSYLHLLLSAFGQHFGYTAEEAKLIYKDVNRDVYFYHKKGRTFQKSSADLTKEEMAKTIDKFMKASAEQGYKLPPATDQGWLREVENEIERSKHYL